MKLSNVSRGSSGEPPSASCTVMNGTPRRASSPLTATPSRVSRADVSGSGALGLTAGGRMVAERTLNSRRVTSGSSACHLLSTRSP